LFKQILVDLFFKTQPISKKKEAEMKRKLMVLVVLAMVPLFFGNALAMEDLVKQVAEGCKVELEKYCKDVTPGERRILACLYARSDKLSSKCEYALYDAAVQLERAVAALAYLANECDADLEKLCSAVKPGEGRLINCLQKNEKQVSNRCKQAVKQVGGELK
jgi:hypothetical protein